MLGTMKLSAYLDLKCMKPADFAAKLGVHSETVRLWLKGTGRPSNPQYDAIEHATDGAVRPDDFRPSSDAPSTPAAPSAAAPIEPAKESAA